MGKAQQGITTTEKVTAEENAGGGLSSVSTLVVRVAGSVPTRVDTRLAGNPEQQLGAVLAYVGIDRTAATIADKRAAAPLARVCRASFPRGRRDTTTTA